MSLDHPHRSQPSIDRTGSLDAGLEFSDDEREQSQERSFPDIDDDDAEPPPSSPTCSTVSSFSVPMLPDQVLLALRCPQCNPADLLHEPVTLRSGITVCSRHIDDMDSSSTPTTPQSASAALNIPPTSSVIYRPAPPVPLPVTRLETGKVDVTVSKIIDLTQQWLQSQKPHRRSHSPTPSPQERPRKRRRRASSHSALHEIGKQFVRLFDPVRSSSQSSIARPEAEALIRFEKDLASELTCEICYMLLYQPITTPCQHTFCTKCLQRSLDHSTACPLCRQDLPGFSYFQDLPQNHLLLSIILQAFPQQYKERAETITMEERHARLDTPVFVCQLSFPGMPTLLHFFEPRYRLMLRRCLESPRPQFGMIMPPGSTTEFGTMLEIKSVHMLPDGRSMVETAGTHRFRILERSTLDGYMVARIERFDDIPASVETLLSNATPITTAELIETCTGFLTALRQGTAPWVVQRLNSACGPQPSDPAQFSFWIAMILPIAEREKVKLLAIRSPRMRLQLVVHWIESLQSNWWFSAGCNIM